jgi:hypothetical protein
MMAFNASLCFGPYRVSLTKFKVAIIAITDGVDDWRIIQGRTLEKLRPCNFLLWPQFVTGTRMRGGANRFFVS